jgi:hypothetical protein
MEKELMVLAGQVQGFSAVLNALIVGTPANQRRIAADNLQVAHEVAVEEACEAGEADSPVEEARAAICDLYVRLLRAGQ